MLKFIVRRIFWTIPVLLVVIFLTFIMMRQIEGNPFRRRSARFRNPSSATSSASSTSTSPGTCSTSTTSRASPRWTSAPRS